MNARHGTDDSVGRDLLGRYAAAVTEGDFERWISLWVDHGIQMAPDFPQTYDDDVHPDVAPRDVFESFSSRCRSPSSTSKPLNKRGAKRSFKMIEHRATE